MKKLLFAACIAVPCVASASVLGDWVDYFFGGGKAPVSVTRIATDMKTARASSPQKQTKNAPVAGPKVYLCVKGFYQKMGSKITGFTQVDIQRQKTALDTYSSADLEHGRDAAKQCASDHRSDLSTGDTITIIRDKDEKGNRSNKVSFVGVIQADGSVKKA